MNRYIPDETIEDIRTRAEIVDVINSYVPIKKAGTNWKGLCPFHQEKTPSFTVNPQRQSFHCFGCGKGGDVFRFVMEKEAVDFPNAAHLLAQRYHVTIPERTLAPNETQEDRDAKTDFYKRIYQLHEDLRDWYESNLINSPNTPVGQYFAERGIPDNLARKFHLGAAPDSWDATMAFCNSRGYDLQLLLTSGIIKENEKRPGNHYDRFRNRLVFPIQNEQGRVVGFSCRTVEKDSQGGKYINSPETPIFKKSRVLYGLSLGRQSIQEKGFIILCEGQIDVIAMHRAGFENTVAPQGTAFTDEQAKILRRYSDRLFFAFDADSAGVKAIMRGMEIALPLGFEVRIIEFPEGLDPDEIYKNEGPEALRNLIGSASDFFEFLIKRLSMDYDLNSSWDVNRLVAKALEFIAKIESPVLRSSYCVKLAGRFKIPEETLMTELKKLLEPKSGFRREESRTEHGQTPAPPVSEPTETVVPEILLKAERILLTLALAHGTVGKRLADDLPTEMISKSSIGRALEKVIELTMMGEWENAPESLLSDLAETPDPELSRILTENIEYDHEFQEWAMADCIRKIKMTHKQTRLAAIMADLRLTVDDSIKTLLLEEYQDLKKEIHAMRRESNAI